jgi:hypothetical protein
MSLEEPTDRCLRGKIAFGVGKPHRQFPRRQRGLIQRQIDDALADIIRNAVPDAIRLGRAVRPGLPAHRSGTDRTSGRRWRAESIFSSVRRTGKADCSTRTRMPRYRVRFSGLGRMRLVRSSAGCTTNTSEPEFSVRIGHGLVSFHVKVRSAMPPTCRICSVIVAGAGLIGLNTNTPLR